MAFLKWEDVISNLQFRESEGSWLFVVVVWSE